MINAATVTIVGRVGTNPQISLGSTGDRVTFRVVSTERRFDKASDSWVDGDECWLTVVCWQALAKAVITTVRRGDPVVVIGRITHRRFEKNGVTQYFTDVRADFVGLDTARIGSRFSRTFADSNPVTGSPQAEGDTGNAGDEVPESVGQEWQPSDEESTAPWGTEDTADGREPVMSVTG